MSESLTEKMEEITTGITAILKDYANVKAENVELKKKLDTSSEDNTYLKDDFDELQEMYDDVIKQRDKLQAENDFLNKLIDIYDKFMEFITPIIGGDRMHFLLASFENNQLNKMAEEIAKEIDKHKDEETKTENKENKNEEDKQ